MQEWRFSKTLPEVDTLVFGQRVKIQLLEICDIKRHSHVVGVSKVEKFSVTCNPLYNHDCF